ncbi:MAG: hypothetical protein LBD73_06870, partial [Deferribacteraceae bacterium]|nr:hypothetical protein [Deferribacteraceae bacterium]
IALAISSVILIGSYSILDGVLAVSERMTHSGDKFAEVQAFERLFVRDVRMMLKYGAADNESITDEDVFFSMVSQNSLTFNKSIPVSISYYLDEADLYREEKNTSMNYVMRMPLLSNVTDIKTEGHDGRDYSDMIAGDTLVFRITFSKDNATYTFTAARLLGGMGE